jgi:hypothetical protein
MASAIIRTKSSLVLHRTLDSIRSFRKALDPSIKVGFVPTMGALHEGSSLVGPVPVWSFMYMYFKMKKVCAC